MAISQQIVVQEVQGAVWTKISSITTIPDTEQEVFVFTVPALTTRVIYSLVVSAIIDLRWHLEADDIVLSFGVTSPACNESERFFITAIELSAGTVVKLKIKSVAGVQSVTCRTELRASDIVD